MKPLIVGLRPGNKPDPRYAALGGASGEFLAKLAGCTLEQFHKRYECVNLETLGFADTMRKIEAAKYVILLGREVERKLMDRKKAATTALGLYTFRRYRTDGRRLVDNLTHIWSIPHPSGQCRKWNDAKMRVTASMLLRYVNAM